MRLRMFMLLLVAPTLAGCATTSTARYVYQDGEFGVVGIPENTDVWPTRYHQRAEELMSTHFPEGYEIVRAEEVVEGSRTLKVEGSTKAELQPVLPTALFKVGTLGRTASRSRADTVKIKECRIIYRRAGSTADVPPGFAAEASLRPSEYLDPNDAERQRRTRPADEGKAEVVHKDAGPAAGD